MDVVEVVENVLSFLDDPTDLVNVACTARRYEQVALRVLWSVPPFNGPPVKQMARLFPPEIRTRLLEGEDPSYRVPLAAFARFDYYARLVRHLRLWQLEGEAGLSAILRLSRPGQWLFPGLRSIHLGLDGESMVLVRPYLSPTLTRVRIDHWESDDPYNVYPKPSIVATVLEVLRLPELVHLDLMDTRYSLFEDHADVVQAFVALVSRLRTFVSYDFTTFRPVFEALANSPNLTELFLDLTRSSPSHVSLSEIAASLHTAFPSLRKLTFLSSVETGSELLRTIDRHIHSLDIRIEGELNVDGLRELTTSLYSTSPSLVCFRCSSSHSGPEDADVPLRAALQPLAAMPHMQTIRIALSFRGSHMLSDQDMLDLFASWPDLRAFSLESDPEERAILTTDDPIGYGLTLHSLVQGVRRLTPHLRELNLSYMDTSVIPDITGETGLRTHVPISLHFSRSHVHDGQAVAGFLRQLWPTGQFSFDQCCLPSRTPSDDA